MFSSPNEFILDVEYYVIKFGGNFDSVDRDAIIEMFEEGCSAPEAASKIVKEQKQKVG